MEHLTIEALAALVDEAPAADEARHLAACSACRGELEALRSQTEALGALPELRPPPGDWEVLEARLRSDGLVKDPGMLELLTLARTPAWMRAAAAVVLFLGGTTLGAAVTSRGSSPADILELAMSGEGSDVERAASAVRVAEQTYVNALTRYRQLLGAEGEAAADPRSRYAALEYLVAASQAAVRQAPGDQFLNGLLASTLAEREAVLRRISSGGDRWF